jgi:hypothetical protein
MRKYVVITCFLLIGSCTQGQPPSLNVSSLPANLKQNANAIVRYETNDLTIENISRATLKVHRIVTVLNEKGKMELLFNQYTTRYITLKNAEVKVYDAEGKLLSRHKKKEMQTVAIGEGLVEDGSVTYFRVLNAGYPVTIESEYELEFSETLNLPRYFLCYDNEAVEESNFNVRVPANIGFRYKSRNLNITPKVTDLGNDKLYHWTVKNFEAFETEEGSVSLEDRLPSVIMTVENFSFYGRTGTMASWKSFGEWIFNLYKGLDELTPAQKDFFIALVKNAQDDREKARLIYTYLQKNFRYVSIQLGIGGLQPFSAQFTDQKKYGDCKGLSNYMKAALNAVGIKSYLAIINAGYNNEPVDPAFPINDFNHAILCVPAAKDTLWLECTSSTTDFGHLGTFTENRHALLVTEKGGMLVATPASKPQANMFFVSSKIELDEDGSGICVTNLKGSGAFKEQLDDISQAKRDDQKEALVIGLGFKQPDDFEFVKSQDENQGWKLNMTLEKIHEFSAGSKLFLPARLYKIWPKKMPVTSKRINDFYFHFPYYIIDTTAFRLPDGYKPEVLPAAKNITCEFGEYKTSYWFDEIQRCLYTTITLLLKKHQIPASKYTEIKKFSDAILEEEAVRLVIRKQ